MKWWKIAALVVAGVYVVLILFPMFTGAPKPTDEQWYNTIVGIVAYLAISLGPIFYGEQLGQGLVGAKMGMISSASPGWAIRFMGWIFLFAPFIVGIVMHFKEAGMS